MIFQNLEFSPNLPALRRFQLQPAWQCQQSFHRVARASPSTCSIPLVSHSKSTKRMSDDESDTGHILSVGKTFGTITLLKDALSSLAITDGFEFLTLRSSDRRYEVKCKESDCNVHVYARAIGQSSIYRIHNSQTEHEYYGITHAGHKNATSSFIAGKIREKLALQPDYKPADIVKDMKADFGVHITYYKAWAAKESAMIQINGTHEESYAQLPKYIEKLKEANPGSHITLETTVDNKFRRVFVCFGASAQGFAHCRPLMGLDGTHLKSKYQGMNIFSSNSNLRHSSCCHSGRRKRLSISIRMGCC